MKINKDQLISIRDMLKSGDEDNIFLALRYLSVVDEYSNNAYLRCSVETAKSILDQPKKVTFDMLRLPISQLIDLLYLSVKYIDFTDFQWLGSY